MTLALDRTEPASEAAQVRRGPDWRVALPALLLLGGGALAIGAGPGAKLALLFLIGGALGLVLYHAAFGFSASWRAFLTEGRGAGLRAQMLMLALASAAFLPAIAAGSLFGQPVGSGAAAPFGLSVLIGAFIFGLGMQLGGGCASGTLYTAGGGSTRMVVVLVFFVTGSLIGTAHLPWWLETPSLGTLTLGKWFGWEGALALQLAAFAAIAAATVLVERRRHGRLDHGPKSEPGWRRLLQGPWPLLWGAALLALLNIATFAVAGHPWSVVFGFNLWGAKAASAAGIDVASWPFWTWSFPKAALEGGLFENSTSTMNFGILAGAFLAAGLAGKFAPTRSIPLGSLAAAVIGGLLMGYGARLAFGCNVGAYFSGIASGSLHGWLWFSAALVGTFFGARLRPFFGLGAPAPSKGC